MCSFTKKLQLPQIPYRGSAPGPRWGNSVPQTSSLLLCPPNNHMRSTPLHRTTFNTTLNCFRFAESSKSFYILLIPGTQVKVLHIIVILHGTNWRLEPIRPPTGGSNPKLYSFPPLKPCSHRLLHLMYSHLIPSHLNWTEMMILSSSSSLDEMRWEMWTFLIVFTLSTAYYQPINTQLQRTTAAACWTSPSSKWWPLSASSCCYCCCCCCWRWR